MTTVFSTTLIFVYAQAQCPIVGPLVPRTRGPKVQRLQFTSLESFDTILIMEIFRNLYANQGGILSAEKGFLMALVRDHYNTEMHFTAVHADLPSLTHLA